MASCLESIKVESVTKRFGPNQVLDGITFDASAGESYCLWGPNGSGKSTLLKIIAGLLRPSKGKISYCASGKTGAPLTFRNNIGMSAPDIMMYEDLSLAENLDFLAKARALPRDARFEDELMDKFSLSGVKGRQLGACSSGMKRKFHLVCALAHKPSALLLDEPTSYMDDAGRAGAEEIVSSLKKDVILIVATNDHAEKAWCEAAIELRIKSAGGNR
ncbi:MAG TPA: ABC transporter ATP-binding protein [bacterium]|nr:ABC transporter ATP-binding protein [bacterium]